MESWGVELWDRWDGALGQVVDSTTDMEHFYGRFLRDRAKVERAYARGLRELIARYTPKPNKKEPEELSQRKEFRLLLKELGFQAGQHEVLEETYGKEGVMDIASKVSESKKEIEECKKDAKDHTKYVNQSYQRLKDAKTKYTRAHDVMESACVAFKKAEEDGAMSRNDIDRARALMDRKVKECHEAKTAYASQVLLTNEEQESYYYRNLVAVLDRLQAVHHDNCQQMQDVMRKCVMKEKEIFPIITKCQDEALAVLGRISKEGDTKMVIDRLKTGNVPPEDFIFEELRIGEDRKIRSIGSQMPDMRIGSVQDVTKNVQGNLYQKKRDLEFKIKEQEDKVAKGQKEVAALRLMVETYTSNPGFGDAKQFKEELDAGAHKVSEAESLLLSLKNDLADTVSKLEAKKTRAPPSPSLSHRSDVTRVSEDSGTQDLGPFQTTPDSCPKEEDEWNYEEDTDGRHSPPPPPPPVLPKPGTDVLSPGPAPPPPPPSVSTVVAVALYDYVGEFEESISMAAKEEFLVVAPDEGGWTMVMRERDGMEGFVPTSFLQLL